MNFLIRSLIILTILTTKSYGEQTVKQLPEKSLIDKIFETIFPEQSADQTSKEKLAEQPIKKATDKATDKNLKKVSEKVAGKPTKKNPEKKKGVDKPLPEISVGSKDAPVIMINYSSLSCGHCAHFNADILPQVQEKYIKPGYLRIIFRDYPGDQVSLRAHQLAWCKGEIKYLDFMKILYANQEKWLLADDPVVALKALALKNGIEPEQFEACLKNQELLDQIIALRLDGQKKYNITATPTIIINAKIYQKALSLQELDDIMKPLITSVKEKGKKS